MTSMFAGPNTEGVLLVDASNAFNSLNRQATLHNVPRICPALGKVFANTYSSPIRLFVAGGGEILSQEGTCQGDPLAMAVYAVATAPLVKHLAAACPSVVQSWYADDDAAADRLLQLRQYWDTLEQAGRGYGYHANAAKTILVTKPEHLDRAREVFDGTGVTISAEGARYLGGVLGSARYTEECISAKSRCWAQELKYLAGLARTQPHAAYVVLTKGLAGRWQYHLRATQHSPEVLQVPGQVIDSELLPALLGHEFDPNSSQRELLSLPTRCGGLAVPILPSLAPVEYAASTKITEPFVRLIVPPDTLTPPEEAPAAPYQSSTQPLTVAGAEQPHNVRGHSPGLILSSSLPDDFRLHPVPRPGITRLDDAAGGSGADVTLDAIGDVRQRARQSRQQRQKKQDERVAQLRPMLPPAQQLLLETAGEKGVSNWLSSMPSFITPSSILNKSDFRDAVCIRYGLSLEGVSSSCICGQDMTIDHAMSCPAGGYPIARHNEIRDILSEAIREILPDVEKEPLLKPFEGETLPHRTANRSLEARLDIRARGFWTRQQDAFFDVRVTHPKASLLSRTDVLRQLKTHEQAKKREYCARVNIVERASFTPLVFSTSGMCGPERSCFLKNLVSLVVEKNPELHYSVVMGQLRSVLSLCLLRWCITCIRGSRASYKRQRHSFLTSCHTLRAR